MAKLNTLRAIENAKGKINTRYDLTYEDIEKIEKVSKGHFDLICKFFVFGYVQGAKAQKKGCAYIGK
ncbi:hypothetical protein C7U54_06130 [Faecalibacillus intestinalis]|uniref:Uncharacterized protein n=1 Tax=Faecalibacillus intestinalis TaxID=1982626 RepID=A0A2T3G319_9FIRM|nr:hypothetical protein [Faecalibacillus intestinalis]PST41913.1 hypothetical protein C7U54_06130 [Faecalibacillus intestinalis]RGG81765.1 hypothetical protein DWW80_08590 [Coprobacillus sp. AF17-17AC]RGG85640.1 hypothetical protein DWW76_08395 [Coprobacillus sp. AF17-11AC]